MIGYIAYLACGAVAMANLVHFGIWVIEYCEGDTRQTYRQRRRETRAAMLNALSHLR